LKTAGSIEINSVLNGTDGVGRPWHNQPMSLAAWYLHKIDQCARLANDAAEPNQRCRLESERRFWLQILAEKIQVDEETLEAVIEQMGDDVVNIAQSR
jgi:hypothetical protein